MILVAQRVVLVVHEVVLDVSGSIYEPSVLLYKAQGPVSEQPIRLHKPLGPLFASELLRLLYDPTGLFHKL